MWIYKNKQIEWRKNNRCNCWWKSSPTASICLFWIMLRNRKVSMDRGTHTRRKYAQLQPVEWLYKWLIYCTLALYSRLISFSQLNRSITLAILPICCTPNWPFAFPIPAMERSNHNQKSSAWLKHVSSTRPLGALYVVFSKYWSLFFAKKIPSKHRI